VGGLLMERKNIVLFFPKEYLDTTSQRFSDNIELHFIKNFILKAPKKPK
jgi:hypothetical protein